MSSVNFLALAERCEQATGPDRLLDQAIGWVAGTQSWASGNPDSDTIFYRGPHYTASLDAAMTLVPDGCEWRVRWCELPNGTWASIARIGEGCGLNTTAVTPALSLCAAALRARAQT